MASLRSTTCVLAAAWLAAAALPSQKPAAPAPGIELARAEELLDAARYDQAIGILDRLLKKEPKLGEALLLRSTAFFMSDDRERGRRDLQAALAATPTLRQGWLNLGGLQMSERDYQAALESFGSAERLDPAASDNHLNIGAALLLLSRLPDAAARFERFVAGAASRALASYLVATNYALAGYAALAMTHLEQAVRDDERMRMQARADQNFAAFAEDERYQALLATDAYRAPAGHYAARAPVAVPYGQPDGLLIGTILDSLQELRIGFDPRVEVTPRWALIWGDLRIKVAWHDEQSSTIEVTAPPGRLTPREWQQRTEALFERIGRNLQVRSLRARARF